MNTVVIAGILIGAFALVIFSLVTMARQSKKDWATLEELQKKAYTVKTKEEIEEFHKEFRDKANKIHNKFINPYLMEIDGYLRGLYKQFKSDI